LKYSGCHVRGQELTDHSLRRPPAAPTTEPVCPLPQAARAGNQPLRDECRKHAAVSDRRRCRPWRPGRRAGHSRRHRPPPRTAAAMRSRSHRLSLGALEVVACAPWLAGAPAGMREIRYIRMADSASLGLLASQTRARWRTNESSGCARQQSAVCGQAASGEGPLTRADCGLRGFGWVSCVVLRLAVLLGRRWRR
jgi:hypothetical protein